MSKKEILQEITVNTSIYDPDLPQKAAAALVDAPLELGPNEGLRLEILFNKNVYQQAAFYQYELTMEHKGPAPETEKEKTKQKIYDVLSEQLGKVSAALKENGCVFRDTAIIGDDLEDDAVHITLYRQETSMVGDRWKSIQTASCRIALSLSNKPVKCCQKYIGSVCRRTLRQRLQKGGIFPISYQRASSLLQFLSHYPKKLIQN